MNEIQLNDTAELKEKDALLWATIAGIEQTQKKYPNLHFFIAAFNEDTQMSAAKVVTTVTSGIPNFETLTKLFMAGLGGLGQGMQLDLLKLVGEETERIVNRGK